MERIISDKGVETFTASLLTLDRLAVDRTMEQARNQTGSLQVVDRLVVPALEKIGRGWEEGTVALAQVYMAGRMCEELVDRFLPPSSSERTSQPKMAIALLDDYHSLGKIIVYSALRASGYELEDYGRLTVPELVQRVCADSVRFILISTLMLRSALQVKEVRQGLEECGSKAKIIVGGAPFRFDSVLWQEVGADGMGGDAAEAVRLVKGYMEVRHA